MSEKPNILHIHSHDTGRMVQPHGAPVRTPAIQRLAEEGVVFRQAFCAAPSCSGSRAALFTGQYPHTNGMLGLAHRGFDLYEPRRQLVHWLREAGYDTGLVGVSHITMRREELGYRLYDETVTQEAPEIVPLAVDLVGHQLEEPFFASVGFHETHRIFFEPSDQRAAAWAPVPPNLPDTPETRADFAAFQESLASFDGGVAAVLAALEERGIAERTLVVCTTDHGLAFPGAKATLHDRGTGVMLVMRGPGVDRTGIAIDAMVQHIDLFPTFCELAGIAEPDWLQGTSLMPLLRGERAQVRDHLFTELTYHCAYEPQRAVRTPRWKYIRRFDDRTLPVLVNCDEGASKDLLMGFGAHERPHPREALYDLVFDPGEACNLVDRAEHQGTLHELRGVLEQWMRDTDDPLLHGPVPAPAGALLNAQDDVASDADPNILVPEWWV